MKSPQFRGFEGTNPMYSKLRQMSLSREITSKQQKPDIAYSL
jgi:hypothetical protein